MPNIFAKNALCSYQFSIQILFYLDLQTLTRVDERSAQVCR